MNKVHFSKNTDEWETPQKLFDELHKEFDFFLDTCATSQNKKVRNFFSKEVNGLMNEWARSNWCNPPYSDLKRWIAKAWREQKKGNLTVMLIPARTDTVGFHEYIWQKPNVEIRFLRGRLKFGDSKNSAPFPSMIVIFRPHEQLEK